MCALQTTNIIAQFCVLRQHGHLSQPKRAPHSTMSQAHQIYERFQENLAQGKNKMLEKALQRDAESRPFEKEIKKMGEIVMSDPSLLDRLDTTPTKSAFIDMYCELAKERNINFSKADLLIAVQEQKHGKDWILPKKILRMIADRF
jgi:hypothetical protein